MAATAAESPCVPLHEFVASVPAGESRELVFHTIWGANFKDTDEEAIHSRRCEHAGYAPAGKVCDYLMDNGSVEFADRNVKDLLACLSEGSRIAYDVTINSASFSLTTGEGDRASAVDISYGEDREIGGMVLRIRVEGY